MIIHDFSNFHSLILVVNYFNDTLPKRNYFDYRGGRDGTIQFYFKEPMPTFAPGSNKNNIERLYQSSQTTHRKLIIDVPLKGLNRYLLEKSIFLFGDRVTVSDETLYVDEHKWFWEVEGVRMFLFDIAKSYPLVYLQKLSVPCLIDWNIIIE